jgi:hypothetical protein
MDIDTTPGSDYDNMIIARFPLMLRWLIVCWLFIIFIGIVFVWKAPPKPKKEAGEEEIDND